MIDTELRRALIVSGGLILLLVLVALASARLETAADATPRNASAAPIAA